MWPSFFVCLVVIALLFCNLSIHSSVYGNTTDILDYNNTSYVNSHDAIDDVSIIESHTNDTNIPHVTIMFDASSLNGNIETKDSTVDDVKPSINKQIPDDIVDDVKPSVSKATPDEKTNDSKPNVSTATHDDISNDSKPNISKTTPDDISNDSKPHVKQPIPNDTIKDAKANENHSTPDDKLDNTKPSAKQPLPEESVDDAKPSARKQAKREEITSKVNTRKTNDLSDEESKRIEEERLKLQAEARLRRRQKEREKESRLATKELLHAGSSEYCDWKSQPIAFIKGDVCGAYYKVLGINRKKSLFDKQDIKKAYRQKSLSVHPDKNPSEDASAAFKVVQDAYECLLDDNCRVDYDNQLKIAEENVSQFRRTIKAKIAQATVEIAGHVHYYVSIAANYIYQTGMDLWNIAGEWEVDWMGEPRPIGKALMMVGLVMKGRFLLQLHALSYAVVRVNYEIAKARGLL